MSRHTKAYIALIFICIVWGTTYLAIRVGVLRYPPFLFAGVRQSVAGILLMILALAFNRRADLSAVNIGRQALVGFLMLTMGNGLVSWGEKFIPSGIAALICSLMPLFAVVFNLAASRREHFNTVIGAGMFMGVVGVGLIFRHSVDDLANVKYLWGMLGVLVATASWALGSLINRRHERPLNPFFNSGLQLLFGGLFMLAVSPVADDYKNFVLWDADGLLALGYLIVFGSLLAYAAYMYELSVLPVGIATIYAYINPMIAVVVGALFLHETLDMYTALAFTAIAVSVYLVNLGYRRQQKKSETMEINTAAMPVES